jgi:hypothetical protein
MSDRRRAFPLLWGASFIAFFGAIAFYNVSSNPRFETIHVLDIIRLMTAGAGFALALFMLILHFSGGTISVFNRAGEKSGEESK